MLRLSTLLLSTLFKIYEKSKIRGKQKYIFIKYVQMKRKAKTYFFGKTNVISGIFF